MRVILTPGAKLIFTVSFQFLRMMTFVIPLGVFNLSPELSINSLLIVGNLHTYWCGRREFDSYQSRICVLPSETESVGT